MKNKRIPKLIEELARHEDALSIEVLEELGTNCEDDEVRRLTVKALISKNVPESLKIIINEEGKGINDLSTNVAMSAINEILSLDEKECALEILNETSENHESENVRETARSVKALVAFC